MLGVQGLKAEAAAQRDNGHKPEVIINPIDRCMPGPLLVQTCKAEASKKHQARGMPGSFSSRGLEVRMTLRT